MKKSILLLAVIFSVGVSSAQKITESEVPAQVKAKFQSLFHAARDIKWRKQKNGSYEAEFKQNTSELGATIDSVGNLKETEKEMKVSELSKSIFNYVAKNYPDYKITEAAQITYADGKPIYEAEITKGKDVFDLLFDGSFKFIKKGHF